MKSIRKPCLLAVLFFAFVATSQACTGIVVTAKDRSVVYARTMEFAIPTNSQVIAIPRGFEYKSMIPNSGSKGKYWDGIQWRSKYNVYGLNAWNTPFVIDGINEKGLAYGAFYFPGYAEYQAVNSQEEARDALIAGELGNWILGNFENVAQVKLAISHIKIAASPLAGGNLNVPLPLHYFVVDSMGNSIVIEPLKGEIVVSDNPVGVITNAPSFDWHLTNIKNYVGLSATNKELGYKNIEITPFGAGSGMLGLPGDFTPPSRFIRAVFLSKAAQATNYINTVQDAVVLAWNLINNFSIPLGAVREIGASKQPRLELTQWTTVWDLKNRVLYFRDYYNPTVRKIDFKGVKLESNKIKQYPIVEKVVYRDVSHLLN